MPAKCGTTFSITVRFGLPIEPILPQGVMGSTLGEFGISYAVAYEQKGDESTGHWQCGLITKDETRQDHLRDRLLNRLMKVCKDVEWNEDRKKHAVCVRFHNDIIQLVGGYCTKQDINPLIVGFTDDDLEDGRARYERSLASRDKRMPVTKSAILPLLRETHERVMGECVKSRNLEKFQKLTPSEKLNLLEKMLISDGYDLSEVLSGIKRNYIVKHWSEYFGEKSSLDILQEFFA